MLTRKQHYRGACWPWMYTAQTVRIGRTVKHARECRSKQGRLTGSTAPPYRGHTRVWRRCVRGAVTLCERVEARIPAAVSRCVCVRDADWTHCCIVHCAVC